MPVAFRIKRESGVDSNRNYMLVLIPRFDCRQQYRPVARFWWITVCTSNYARETLVIGDIRDIKPSVGMPRTVPLGGEPLASIPRKIGMTVKVDHHVVRITHADRRHRPRYYGAGAVNGHERQQCRERDCHFTHHRNARSSPSVCPHDSPDEYDDGERCEHRDVLAQREQREAIEQRANWREHRVGGGMRERRVGNAQPGYGIEKWRGADQGSRQDQNYSHTRDD